MLLVAITLSLDGCWTASHVNMTPTTPVVGLQAPTPSALDAVLEASAVQLSRELAVKGKTLGLGVFKMTDGRVAELGQYVATILEHTLIRTAKSVGFEVATRSDLCQVIRENGLWLNDQFDPNLPQKLGTLRGLDLLLAGSLTDLGTSMQLTLTMLNTRSGAAEWSYFSRVRLDPSLRALLNRDVAFGGCEDLGLQSRETTPRADRLQVKVWTDRLVYNVNEPIDFYLRTNRDAYVTLLNISNDRRVVILFPNAFHASHFVRANNTIAVPGPDASFRLRVLGPPGLEQVRAIATQTPIRFMPKDFEEPGSRRLGFLSLIGVEPRILNDDIRKERAKADPTRWAEDRIIFQVK